MGVESVSACQHAERAMNKGKNAHRRRKTAMRKGPPFDHPDYFLYTWAAEKIADDERARANAVRLRGEHSKCRRVVENLLTVH